MISADHSGGMCYFKGITNKEGARQFVEDMQKIVANSLKVNEDNYEGDYLTGGGCKFDPKDTEKILKKKRLHLGCNLQGGDMTYGNYPVQLGVHRTDMGGTRKDGYQVWYQIDDENVLGEPVFPSMDKIEGGMEVCSGNDPSIVIDGKVMSLPELYEMITKKKL